MHKTSSEKEIEDKTHLFEFLKVQEDIYGEVRNLGLTNHVYIDDNEFLLAGQTVADLACLRSETADALPESDTLKLYRATTSYVQDKVKGELPIETLMIPDEDSE